MMAILRISMNIIKTNFKALCQLCCLVSLNISAESKAADRAGDRGEVAESASGRILKKDSLRNATSPTLCAGPEWCVPSGEEGAWRGVNARGCHEITVQTGPAKWWLVGNELEAPRRQGVDLQTSFCQTADI